MGRGGGAGRGPLPKDKEALKEWLDRLADTLKRLAVKAVEALPVIVGSAAVAILSFLGNVVGFVATHTCFCCRTYWCMVGAKCIEKASTKRNHIFANLLTN